MQNINVNLQFEDEGYGLTHFIQRLELEGPLEIEAEDFKEGDGERVNAMVRPAWEWFCKEAEEIKRHLARTILSTLNRMRKDGEKHVPYESYDAILAKLPQPHRITFYKERSFEIFYWIYFNNTRYQAYVTVQTKKLSIWGAAILIIDGFKAPKKEKLSLKTAAELYAFHVKQGNTENLYKHYAALPANEIDAYVDLFIADESDIDERIDCLLYLALFSNKCGRTLPDKLYNYLIEKNIFYYGEIYLRADEKFVDALTTKLGSLDYYELKQVSVNHILCALAAIPCKRTNDFLIESSKAHPTWATKLHVLPKDYAYVGGWEAVEGGAPLKLTSDEVTAFERCDKKKASKLSPLTAIGENCGFCGQPLTLAFDDEHKLATCLYCACYQNIYMKDGLHWHEKNAPDIFFQEHPEYMKNDEEITARFEYGLRPSKEKRQAIWTAHQYVEISSTQIGGMPTAVNNMRYPICPDCGETMHFVAQLDMADVEDGEGLYYFFVCEKCNVTAANYDQS
jgi:hypothetical protein